MRQQYFQVGPFSLHPANRLLTRDEVPINLSPKAFDTLVYLVQNCGRLVTRDELMKALWPDSFVEDGNLSVYIFQVRKALGERDDGRAFIQTVPRKGYRFNADVKIIDPGAFGKSPAPLQIAASPSPGTSHNGTDPAGLSSEEPARPDGAQSDLTEASVSWLSVPFRFPESGSSPEQNPAVSEAAVTAPAGETQGHLGRRKVIAAAVCLIALGMITGLVIGTRQGSPRSMTPVRLTSFAPELSVTAAAISPDGRSVAYANPAGLFIQQLATRTIQTVRPPASGLDVSSLSWFPSGNKILVAGIEPQAASPTAWIQPVQGGSPAVKIGNYRFGVVSPDGSAVASVLENSGVTELWLLQSDGTRRRRIAEIDSREALGSVFWSLDGQRILFVCLRWDEQLRRNSGTIRSVRLPAGRVVDVFSGPNLSGDAASLTDARLVYGQLRGANPSGSYGAELRQLHIDGRTGKAVGDPLLLGTWPEPFVGLGASADGRRLTFRTVLTQHSVYEGDLDKEGRSLGGVRRLTFGLGRDDFPRAWTPDAKSVIFDSNRNGKWEVFKQASDEISDEPYLQGVDDEFSPRMSPDGRWLLYLDRPRNWHEPEPVQLMRVPASGGSPQLVLEASNFSEWGLRFECPHRAGASCVLAQREGGEIVFRAFDPSKPSGSPSSEISRISVDPNRRISWCVSPDGSRLAWVASDGQEAAVHFLTVALDSHGREFASSERQVALKGWSHLHAISWSADGNGWYVTTRLPESWTLLYATVEGRTQTLWHGSGEYAPDSWPSPDGRHLAFSQENADSNVWLLENF